MHGKNIGKTFWVHFFGGSNGTIVSSRVGPPPFFFFLREPPHFWVPPFSEANLKSYPPFSESYPNWCMQIVRNTFK